VPHAIVDSVIHSLSYLHYFALLIGFFFWLLLTVITYMVRKQFLFFSLFSLLTVMTFVSGPIVGYFFVETYVKANHLADKEVKQLRFIDKAIIKGAVTNDSHRPLAACRIMAMAFPKKMDQPLVPWLKSLKTTSVYDLVELKSVLAPGESEAIYLSLPRIKEVENTHLYLFTFCQ